MDLSGYIYASLREGRGGQWLGSTIENLDSTTCVEEK